MPKTQNPSQAHRRTLLRVNAETLIRRGEATSTGGGTLSTEALELLYRRASNPDFAADGLKLLHELQTHQVELDLMHEQIQANEQELTEALNYYQALYQLAPTAYLVLGLNGRVIETNDVAATLLGIAPEQSVEQTVTQYLSPLSRTTVAALIKTLKTPGSAARCLAHLADAPDCPLSITASLSPLGDTVLMTLSPQLLPHSDCPVS